MKDMKTFLLVDDDEDDTSMFCEAIAAIDPALVCYTAENGIEALEILKDNKSVKPELIYMDINMPVMDGWECLTMLKQDEQLKDIPVIVYSTSSRKQDALKAFSLGALCFFTKPDQFKDLKKVLKTFASTPHTELIDAVSEYCNVKFAGLSK
jgi:CheY-like chemotaxis protein